MLLNEIKSIQPSLDVLFERANNGDREAQLIVEGIMDALSGLGKKLVKSAAGKLKPFILSLALLVPALAPNLSSAMDVDSLSRLYQLIVQMSESEFYASQIDAAQLLKKDGSFSDEVVNKEIANMLSQTKSEYLINLKYQIQDELTGKSVDARYLDFKKKAEAWRGSFFDFTRAMGYNPDDYSAEQNYVISKHFHLFAALKCQDLLDTGVETIGNTVAMKQVQKDAEKVFRISPKQVWNNDIVPKLRELGADVEPR